MLHTEKHFKIRKEHVLIKCLLNKVPLYLLHCKDMVKPYYINKLSKKKHQFEDALQRSCS